MWAKFKQSKVWEIHETDSKQNKIFSKILKYIVFLICLSLIIFFWKNLIHGGHVLLGSLWKSTVKTVSSNLWQEMRRDEFGNVNIMLVWIWWDDHHWWYLADSMIATSRNPELWAVTMISIPRDLYVNSSWYLWRINGLFARGYSRGWNNIWSGAENLIAKVEEILWLEIPYYLVADFQWFKEIVDTLWWIDIYIENTIHDITYPDDNLWYQTFHISAWQQTLDWDTALKYVRSRHTTSDFARSQRQQNVIKAVIDTALQRKNITNVWKLKEMYSTYTRMVYTNISSKEMVGMFRYIYDFKHIFSFWLNTYCTYSSYKLTDAGCFLYNGNREAFGGQAVMVPNGAKSNNISFYDYIQRFTFFVTHNNWYLVENPRILIKNAIDKNFASQHRLSPTGRANKIAVKLKKYWFNLAWIENHSWTIEQTKVVTYWDQNYSKTIDTFQYFFPVNVVEKWENQFITWEELNYDMELIIWNDFISYTANTPFSYER
jgi:LCP family protein required for cell wall assembly